MILSMTGFGSKSFSLRIASSGTIALSVEMKSVNSRFFECVCKLPSFLLPSEIKILRNMKPALLRGRVYLSVKIAEQTDTLEKVVPALKLVEGYVNAVKKIKKTFKLEGELAVSDILQFHDVFVHDKSRFTPKIEKNILDAISQTTLLLVKSRKEEGKVLQKDLEKRFAVCGQRIKKINTLFAAFMKKYKEEIKQILSLQENGKEQDKLKLDELYSMINKIDIHEEITRFNSHLTNVKKVIKEKTVEKGKRIDFILQELLRESNTILAKCSHFDISALAVDIKVELEKAREQTQNIV